MTLGLNWTTIIFQEHFMQILDRQRSRSRHADIEKERQYFKEINLK